MEATVRQQDFSGGWFSGYAPAQVPENGASEIIDGLLSEDGAVKRRGGGTYLSSAFGSGGLVGLWAGDLAASDDAVAAVTGDHLWRADGTPFDGAPTDTGFVGLAKMVGADGAVFSRGIGYAGGTKANYSTGTVSVAIGSTAVTGVGTSWLANASPGQFIRIPSPPGDVYTVKSVLSDTDLLLTQPARATASGVSYLLTQIQGMDYSGEVQAVAGGRLWLIIGDMLRFSAVSNLFEFAPDDYHRFPERPVGAYPHRDGLMVFTRGGVYLVSNIAYELIDAIGNVQQRIDQIDQEIVLVSSFGLASWRGSVIAPAESGIWLLDGIGQPVNIARNIHAAWRDQATLGPAFIGQAAVYRGHYLLPVFNGISWETWVCRLDQGFSWVRWTGFGGAVKAWAANPAHATGPKLYAAPASGQRVVDASGMFGGSWNADADGTVPELQLTTRGYRLPRQATASKLRALDKAADQWAVSSILGWGDEEPLQALAESSLSWRVALDVPWFIRLVFRSSSQTAALYELDLQVREKGRQ